MDKAKTIAQIALTLPAKPTSADMLRVLNMAYDAGELAGYTKGIVTGQEHTAKAMEMIVFGNQKVTFDCNQDRQAHLEEFLGQQWRDQS